VRKILFVAYHFHPDLEIGAVRSVKFAKYLPEFGWSVDVVSVESRHYDRVDPAPLAFPCSVHRSGMWPTMLSLWKGRARPARPASGATKHHGSRDRPQIPKGADFSPRRVAAWKRAVIGLSATPDPLIGWLVPATRVAIAVARRENVDLIYTSAPPFTGHLVGLLASWLTGRPLVADFRDPWTTGSQPKEGVGRFYARISRFLERCVVRRARLVVAATPAVRDDMVAAHGAFLDKKCVSILNGFDAADFAGLAVGSRDTTRTSLSFVHAGTLYGGRNPLSCLIAIGELLAEGSFSRATTAIDFYGPVEIDTTPLSLVMDNYSLHGIVRFHAAVPRAEYITLIREADVLLLLGAERYPWAIDAKSFEYLATGNQILLLAGPHTLADFLKPYDNVHRADPHDVPGIKACIARIVDQLRSGDADRRRNLESLTHLHKRELTRELARLLAAVVKTDPPDREA